MFPILIACLIFIVVAGATWWFGLWSNLITLINLFLASLIASSIYQPVANLIFSKQKSFVYLVDFIAVWLSFVIAFIVLRGLTDLLSSYRLKFDPIVEMSGRTIFSLWVAGVFTCFAMFTLQMAPLSPDFYGDRSNGHTGTIPDRAWLAFVQSRSRGALSAGQDENFLFSAYELKEHEDDKDLNARVFDPFAGFLIQQHMMRISISLNRSLRVSM
ncbi:MAG: hypothetical protein AAFN77_13910 [Planctomycetota bacterium]